MKKEQIVNLQKKCLSLLIVFIFLFASNFVHAQTQKEEIALKICSNFYSIKDYKQAIISGEQAIEKYPTNVLFYIITGHSYLKLKNFDKAKQFFEMAKFLEESGKVLKFGIKKDIARAMIYAALGEIYLFYSQQEKEKANNIVNEQVKNFLKKAARSFHTAAGEYAKAISLTTPNSKKVTDYIPANLFLKFIPADLYLKSSLTYSAIGDTFNAFYALFHGDSIKYYIEDKKSYHMEYGDYYLIDASDYEKIYQVYIRPGIRVIISYTHMVSFHFNYGLQYLNLKEYNYAIGHFSEMNKYAKNAHDLVNQAYANKYLAQIFYEIKKFELAEEYYTNAYELFRSINNNDEAEKIAKIKLPEVKKFTKKI